MRHFRLSVVLAISLLALSLASGCSSAKKKHEPILSIFKGKKIALVEVEGEATPRSVVEVALVNELIKRGTFELINKREVEAARVRFDQDPTDWRGIAKRAGAEVAMRASVLKFSADENQGYSSVKEFDDQLAAERGKDEGETERLYKVRSMKGEVSVNLEFTDLATGESRDGDAHAEETVQADAKSEAIHLPPKLRFLEQLAQKAFERFFEENE